MLARRLATLALSSSLALGAIACASTASTTDSPAAGSPATSQVSSDSTMLVSVTHNRSDGGVTTIYIEPVSGVRSTLGTIESGMTKTFTYRPEALNRQVRLIALNASGQALQSEVITVPRGAGIAWNLQANSVRIRR